MSKNERVINMVEQLQPLPEEQQRKVRNIAPEGGVTMVYANNVAIGATVFDLRIVLGQIMEVNPEELVVYQNTMVVMSWLQAKILAEVLQSSIDQFEKRNGAITMPAISQIAISPPNIPLSMSPKQEK